MESLCRVEFVYSEIYDQHYRSDFELSKHEGEYPDEGKVRDFLGRLETEWRKDEARVFTAIESVTGFAWSVKHHTCYVVGASDPFSDPLTMSVFQSQVPIDYVVDVLTHEMIHRHLIQPALNEQVTRLLEETRKRFPGENENVVIHILVHAIHDIVFRMVFSESRLVREKKHMSALSDYRRAWEIVDALGADALIREFFGNSHQV